MIENKKKRMIGYWKGFLAGLGITLLIALLANYVARFPFLSIMGQLVLAILIGIVWRATIGLPASAMVGVSFSSKKLLRAGIILLGMRLDLLDIYNAGLGVFSIAVIHVVFTLLVVYWLTRLLGVEKKLGILTACGTAICGAAAVIAIAPQIRAKDSHTAISAATVAVLGTIFTFVYTFSYPILQLNISQYGVFAGGTLHEVAHVVAAAAVGGDQAVDIAVVTKLTRVLMLVPVALFLGVKFSKEKNEPGKSAFSFSIVPWFILGFLAMSGIKTLGIVSPAVADSLVSLAYLLIGMAMAGVGLNVDFKTFRTTGTRSFTAGLIGSIALALLGYLLVVWTI
ncbi:YeiH family protein [Virgibacillus senegalensis]|uniref:YeiH family protein n=1 Tax=Virgibacillus senegalensis TaxID=1499679 RepID=UPI00069F34D5|nr:YeiH family protein [Virgibacillus senegalensis]